MRVAIIIPVFNHAHYVSRALESCVAQTRRPDRIICLDDGSSDDSIAVCKSYTGQGVEVHSQENVGAHHTINRLVTMAAQDCDVVSILNSDDYYETDRLARCLPVLKSSAEKSVVCTGVHVIDGAGASIDPAEPRAKWFRAVWSWQERPDTHLCEWLGLANFPATSSNIVARTDFLKRFPFRPYRFNHDYYFLAQAALRDVLAVIPQPLVNYRVHANNTMNTSPTPLLREMLRMHLDLAHDLAPELLTDAALRTRYACYRRALWDNVSSFHPSLFEVLLAGLAASQTEEALAAVVASLTNSLPELQTYPNKSMVNAWNESGPLGASTGLTEKYETLRAENRFLKTENKAWKEATRLWARAAGDKSLAWKRLLGLWKGPSSHAPPEEQAAALRGGGHS